MMFSFFHSLRNAALKNRLSDRRHSRRRPSLKSGLEQLEDRRLLSTLAQIGGAGTDVPDRSSAMDAAGNIYLGGRFQQTVDFDPGPGVVALTSAGDSDGFVAKYAADGSLLWARRYGGIGLDQGNQVALDPTGAYVYATGFFNGSADFTGDNLPDVTSNSGDMFVLKLDAASGATAWVRAVSGTGSSEVVGMAVGADGFVYTSGQFTGTCDFDPGPNTFALSSVIANGKTPSPDAFVWKLSPTGDLGAVWQIGGKGRDSGNNIIVDGTSFYLLGGFSGTVDLDPTAGSILRTSNNSSGDIFYGKYSTTSGSPVWVQTIGNAGASASALGFGGDANNLYVEARIGAYIAPTDFDPGSGTANLTPAGSFDAVLAKYSKADGSFVWAKQFGAAGEDQFYGNPVVDAVTGAVYVGGGFNATVDFDPGSGTANLTSAGLRDGFLIKLDSSGNYLNAWRAGGTNEDGWIRPIGLFGNTVKVAGHFQGVADFPTGGTLTSNGSTDIYVMALDQPAISPLLAAATGPGAPIANQLTNTALEPIVAEATARWSALGADPAQLAGVQVVVANLSGAYLGLASGHTITLDRDAAGWGWFIDVTPKNDSEFFRPGNQGEQDRMDLLTVVMHELGHLLQQDHDADGVMAATLVAGVRNTSLLNEDSQVVDAVFSQLNEPHTNNVLSTVLDEHRWLHRPRLQRRK